MGSKDLSMCVCSQLGILVQNFISLASALLGSGLKQLMYSYLSVVAGQGGHLQMRNPSTSLAAALLLLCCCADVRGLLWRHRACAGPLSSVLQKSCLNPAG